MYTRKIYKEQMTQIVNSESLFNTFVNLYQRWLDECQYEDIKDYAKVLLQKITEILPKGTETTFVGGTKRPFGVKFKEDGKTYHVWLKKSGGYLSICMKVVL